MQIIQMLDITYINLISRIFLGVISLADNSQQDIKDVILSPVKIIPCLNNGLWPESDFRTASFFLRFI